MEDQHNEMEVFCHSEGYDELVFVEDKGASAIKLNDSYRLMIDQVKEEIEKDPGIRCFAVWELSRAFRNELVFQEVKSFLVERRIQFLVKNPYLKLLNPDGSVNSGFEIALTLMATLAKQEMELKKERFKRAKDAMRNQGRFTGGRCPKTGYKVGEDGYYEIDEEKAPLVRMVFEMYSTGRYSIRSLYDELKEMGCDVNYHFVARLVGDRSYIDGKYPPLISQELWDRCVAVRNHNYLALEKGHRYCFGSGIFRCSCCGNRMVPMGYQYRCYHHTKFSPGTHCENGLTIRIENMDGLLWYVASREEALFRAVINSTKRKEYESQVEALKKKIETTEKKLSFLEEKKSRIRELYLEGDITKEDFKKRQNKTLLEAQTYNDTILSYTEKLGGLQTLLDGSNKSPLTTEKIKSMLDGVISVSDLKSMQEIVRKHISRVTTSPDWYGKDRDTRATRQNAQLITIEMKSGEVKKYIYVARKYKGHMFWKYGGEYPVKGVQKIVRESSVLSDGRSFRKLDTW